MMFKRHLGTLAVGAALVVAAQSSNAVAVVGQGTWQTTLQSRDIDGDGRADAFYDTDLDITWLRDANFAATVAFNSDNHIGQFFPSGRLPLFQARAFVAELDVSGVRGWRLPKLGPLGPATCITPTDGFLPCPPYQSELGHLFASTLGNLGAIDPATGQLRSGVAGVDFGWVNTGPFVNVGITPPTPFLLSGTIVGFPTWFFEGVTSYVKGPGGEFVLAWAVHDGDIGVSAVPEATTASMLLGGLAFLSLLAFGMRPGTSRPTSA